MIEYLDYPACVQADENGDADATGNFWHCQIYLKSRDKQTAGYPAFDDPSVIEGYYVSSFIPSVKAVSYAKASEVVSSYSGASAIVVASAAVASTIATLLF